ncbi:MAG: hypothetical protein IRY99_24465 [Isosphaeraceae bacterium]|nr:hypothetical protein [Isosphaeraceae bacterium]
MAFLYSKPDPSGRAERWMVRIKIGKQQVAVSLRLKVSGTKKLAEARANTLQAECHAGALSPSTADWLGPKTTARLQRLMAQARLSQSAGAPDSWDAAYRGYLAACEAKDSVTPIPGTARTVERTKKVRREKVRQIARWLQSRGEPFLERPFTELLIEWIEHRKRQGCKPNTLWAGDYTYGVLWGEWMHRRGLCERPERERIREHIPPKGAPLILLPSPAEDAEAIRFFRDHRNHVVYKDGRGTDLRGKRGINWRASRRYAGAWALCLLVRGLGCRPSEASALCWRTVSQDLKTVTFLSTKTRLAREVPVLYRWVHEGLAELRERHGNDGPVCRSTEGRAWQSDSGYSYCWREILRSHGRPKYTLKQAQKLYIAQTLKLGFPPHVVANWTGHTLTVQERHYCANKSYLPARAQDEYGEFGRLTEWGEEVRRHLSSFANLLPQSR